MNVSIIGLGKLGLPLAAALQSRGIDVIGADIDERRVELVNAGIAPFQEPGLEALLPIKATTNVEQAVWCTDTTIVLVATPSLDDGSFSLEYILPACEQIGSALASSHRYHTVIISSTVMPGDCDGPIKETLERSSGLEAGISFGLCYVPEFVALGEVINCYLYPDFLLIGAINLLSVESVRELYGRLCGDSVPMMVTNLVNAEIAKIALNCYLTTKIAFANQLSAVCGNLSGADVDVVTKAIALDSRINDRYLKGGTSYGGPCFPRDDRALMALIDRASLEVHSFVGAVSEFNKAWAREGLLWTVGQQLIHRDEPCTVAVLGLAFKPNTDCTIDSVGVYLLEELSGGKDKLVAYDPLVAVECSLRTPQECVDTADIIVITTMDEAFKGLEFRQGQTVIDPWRTLCPEMMKLTKVNYIALGLGPQSQGIKGYYMQLGERR